MGLLSQPVRPVGGTNYSAEARKLLRSGYTQAANRVALAGVENRPRGIRSYEGRKEEERLAAAADRFDRMSRYRALTGRGSAAPAAEPAAEAKPASTPATPTAASPVKPYGNTSPSEYAAAAGRKAMEQDKSDAEGREVLQGKLDAFLSKAQSEYDRKQKVESVSSSTDALNKAVAESQAKSAAAAVRPSTSGKAPLSDTLAAIAKAREETAAALNMPKVEMPKQELTPLRFPKSPAQSYAESNAALEEQGRRNVLGEYGPKKEEAPRSKSTKEERDKARADAAAALATKPASSPTAKFEAAYPEVKAGMDPQKASALLRSKGMSDKSIRAMLETRGVTSEAMRAARPKPKDRIPVPEFLEGTAVGALWKRAL